jgi:hypothetical protein
MEIGQRVLRAQKEAGRHSADLFVFGWRIPEISVGWGLHDPDQLPRVVDFPHQQGEGFLEVLL